MGQVRELDRIMIQEWERLAQKLNFDPTEVGTSDTAMMQRKDLYSLLLHIDQFGRRPYDAVKHLCAYVEQYDSDDDVKLPRVVAAGLVYLSWAMNATVSHREWSHYANEPSVMWWLPTVPTLKHVDGIVTMNTGATSTDDGEKQAISELQQEADEMTALDITKMHQQAITSLTDQIDGHSEYIRRIHNAIKNNELAILTTDAAIVNVSKQLRYTAYKASAYSMLLMLAAFVIFYKYFA